MLTMRPYFRRIISFAASRETRNVPVKLVRMMRSTMLAGVRMAWFMDAMPALFTSTSRRPWRRWIDDMTAFTPASSPTSARWCV
jgi:hypothetical protein